MPCKLYELDIFHTWFLISGCLNKIYKGNCLITPTSQGFFSFCRARQNIIQSSCPTSSTRNFEQSRGLSPYFNSSRLFSSSCLACVQRAGSFRGLYSCQYHQLNWFAPMHGNSRIAGALNRVLIPFQFLWAKKFYENNFILASSTAINTISSA